MYLDFNPRNFQDFFRFKIFFNFKNATYSPKVYLFKDGEVRFCYGLVWAGDGLLALPEVVEKLVGWQLHPNTQY